MNYFFSFSCLLLFIASCEKDNSASQYTTLPDSYTLSDIPSGIIGDFHQLSFDGVNRVAKDSSLSGSGFVNYYSYPCNNIASTVLFQGSSSNNQLDTKFLSSRNVNSEHIHYPKKEGTPDSLSAALDFSFSSYANPAYNHAVSKAVGPW